ncbi:hypothetical protein MMC28_003960 [Mycoblastus sanguinarius]|nr:hypothetical protein [Mycoblastus sanguinarius]
MANQDDRIDETAATSSPDWELMHYEALALYRSWRGTSFDTDPHIPTAYYQDWQSEESSDTENTTESQSPRPHDSQQQVDSDQRPTLHKRVMPWLHKTYNYFRSGWQQLLHRKGRDSTNKVNPSEARKPEETGSAWIGSWGYESSRSAEVVAGSDGSQGTALASSDALGEGEASYLLDDSCDEGFILSEMDLPFDDTRFRSPL